MKTIARLLFVVPLLAAGIALGASSPAAAATPCTTAILGGTIKESVVVPAGADCSLVGVTVRGGVTVEPGADFRATGGTEIRGVVTATDPFYFYVSASVVRGGVTVAGSTNADTILITDAQVRGDLVYAGNTGRDIDVFGNTVRGSVILRDNIVTFDTAIHVTRNVIDLNLDCSGNTPGVSNSNLPNTVGGAKLGQCAIF